MCRLARKRCLRHFSAVAVGRTATSMRHHYLEEVEKQRIPSRHHLSGVCGSSLLVHLVAGSLELAQL